MTALSDVGAAFSAGAAVCANVGECHIDAPASAASVTKDAIARFIKASLFENIMANFVRPRSLSRAAGAVNRPPFTVPFGKAGCEAVHTGLPGAAVCVCGRINPGVRGQIPCRRDGWHIGG
jgi:hypothetical protein